MKLAEALQLRADLNRRIAQINSRLTLNALVQEGEKPAEDPNELLKELDDCVDELEALIGKINLANCKATVDGKTLTELISRRDMLTTKINSYNALIENASRTAYRATHTEIKIVSAVNAGALRKQTDAMSKELRELDNKIQMTNWMVEL